MAVATILNFEKMSISSNWMKIFFITFGGQMHHGRIEMMACRAYSDNVINNYNMLSAYMQSIALAMSTTSSLFILRCFNSWGRVCLLCLLLQIFLLKMFLNVVEIISIAGSSCMPTAVMNQTCAAATCKRLKVSPSYYNGYDNNISTYN